MRIGGAGWIVLGCVMALSAPARAEAQEYYELPEAGVTGPFVWNLGGTLAIPLGDSADRVDLGGGFTVGLTFNPNVTFGVQFEYGVNWAGLNGSKLSGALQSSGISGSTLMQYFDLNAVVRPFHAGKVGVYLLGGGGAYYRNVEVTQFEGTAVAPYCDPWLLYCSAVPVSVSSVIGSRTSWDLGLDAGIGLTYAVAPPVRLYLEVRYHYIFGPSFTTPGGGKQTADGQFLPITIGVRF